MVMGMKINLNAYTIIKPAKNANNKKLYKIR